MLSSCAQLVQSVQQLGRAKLKGGRARMCLHFEDLWRPGSWSRLMWPRQKKCQIPAVSHWLRLCVCDREMHQHAEIWPLAHTGRTNSSATGGWKREFVLVEVWEEFHSRELKHWADTRQRGMAVSFFIGFMCFAVRLRWTRKMGAFMDMAALHG